MATNQGQGVTRQDFARMAGNLALTIKTANRLIERFNTTNRPEQARAVYKKVAGLQHNVRQNLTPLYNAAIKYGQEHKCNLEAAKKAVGIPADLPELIPAQ